MTDPAALLADGRPDEALRRVEELLRDDPDSIELLALRVDCLVAVGQFELAAELAELVLVRDPDQRGVADQQAMLREAMARPPLGSEDPRLRAYASEVPAPLLRRVQSALHHQTYNGVQCVKSPFDLALYQQLVHAVRPRTIIEVGSKAGGSGLFFGDLLRNFAIDGTVRSYDICPVTEVQHPLVTFAYGNGRRLGEVISDDDLAATPRPLLIVEDADHSEETTAAVLAFFHPRLRPGDWLVVEDGNITDMYPLHAGWVSGPHRALQAFFREHADDYRVGAEYCDFYAYNGTTASNGFLERR